MTERRLRPSGGRRRERSGSDRRFLCRESPDGILVRALIGLLLGGGAPLLLLDGGNPIAVTLALAVVGWMACTSLLVWLFPPAEVCVFVGVDGVVVWGRFIPYTAIAGVREEWRFREAGSEGMTAWSEADIWTIYLDLRGGESLRLASLEYDRDGLNPGVPAHQNERGAPMIRAIEAGRAAALAGRRERDPLQEELIARGGRTPAEWVEGLRRLGAGAVAGYRGLPVDREALSRLLAEPQARASMRAAAAVTLVAAGDAAAKNKLRIAATQVAEPRLRVALERAADAAEEGAVVEALEALEALEADGQASRRA